MAAARDAKLLAMNNLFEDCKFVLLLSVVWVRGEVLLPACAVFVEDSIIILGDPACCDDCTSGFGVSGDRDGDLPREMAPIGTPALAVKEDAVV